MRSISLLPILCLLAISGLAGAIVGVVPNSSNTYVTWDSLEPDKWASIWLIKNKIDPKAKIEVRPTGQDLGEGIPFGVPQAKYKRSGQESTFESLLKSHLNGDEALQRMGAVITAIETTAWSVAKSPLTNVVEHNFRRMQHKFGRIHVPISCYSRFFDVLYQQIHDNSEVDELDQKLREVVASQKCEQGTEIASRSEVGRVQEIKIDNLLHEIASHKKVVFVDTREPEEYQKSHIPGAINLPMRDINKRSIEWLKMQDRVISYCVKDFRGYEVARMMLENGIKQVAVMTPHGLSGWQSLGLPLESMAMSGVDAKARLMQCARDFGSCTK